MKGLMTAGDSFRYVIDLRAQRRRQCALIRKAELVQQHDASHFAHVDAASRFVDATCRFCKPRLRDRGASNVRS